LGGDYARPLLQFVSQREAPLVPASCVDLLVTLNAFE
jgi:hypothetical protein